MKNLLILSLLGVCLYQPSAAIRRHRSAALYPNEGNLFNNCPCSSCHIGESFPSPPSYSFIERLIPPSRTYPQPSYTTLSTKYNLLRPHHNSIDLNSFGAPLPGLAGGPLLSGSLCGLGTSLNGQIGCGGLGGSIVGPLGTTISGSIGHPTSFSIHSPLGDPCPCSTRIY